MSAYYRFIIGTGTAWCSTYVIKTDEPTTNYTALTNMLIDYLVDKGDYRILDMENEYEWDENGEKIYERKDHSWVHYPDEFVVESNCGDVLMHYGEFRIEEIQESEIKEYDEMVEVE